MICGFGSFKRHVTLVFFQGALLKNQDNFLSEGKKNLHSRSMKFSNADEVDENLISRYLREAVKINEKGITAKNKMIEIPEDLRSALKQNNILDKFEATNYTNRKEFILWIETAKRLETRSARILKTIEKVSKGIKFS